MLANVRPRPMLPSLAANFLSKTRVLRMAQAMVMRGCHWSAIRWLPDEGVRILPHPMEDRIDPEHRRGQGRPTSTLADCRMAGLGFLGIGGWGLTGFLVSMSET